MFNRSKTVKGFLSLVPGKRHLGPYRFLPIFFCIGGIMEWIMINVRIGSETFYDVYRRKQSERDYQQKIADGLIVLNQPAAKWKMVGFHMCHLRTRCWTLDPLLGCNFNTNMDIFKESRVKSWWRNLFQHAGFIVYMVSSYRNISNTAVKIQLVGDQSWK